MPELDRDPDPLALSQADSDGESVEAPEREPERDGLDVADVKPVCVPVRDGDGVPVRDTAAGVGVTALEADCDSETVGQPDGVTVSRDAFAETELEAVLECEAEAERDGIDALCDRVARADGVDDGDDAPESDARADAESVTHTLVVAVAVASTVSDGDAVAERENDALCDSFGLAVPDALAPLDSDAPRDALECGEIDALGV